MQLHGRVCTPRPSAWPHGTLRGRTIEVLPPARPRRSGWRVDLKSTANGRRRLQSVGAGVGRRRRSGATSCATIRLPGKLPTDEEVSKRHFVNPRRQVRHMVPRNLPPSSGADGICSHFRRRPTPATTSGAATNAPYGRSPRPVSLIGRKLQASGDRERDLALLGSSVRRGGRVSREVVARAAVRHVARMAAGDPQPHAPHCVPTPTVSMRCCCSLINRSR